MSKFKVMCDVLLLENEGDLFLNNNKIIFNVFLWFNVV